jgi:D-alanyl-D-alanine carboxypeptidase (penicillin-binding protein 5/6)
VHGRYQPASILKLLTADTILPSLPGNRSITVSASAADTEGSKAGLLAGGTYSIDNLFSGLLLVSGNDTAAALAEAYGGVAKTVTAMNAEALALGAYDTFVQTPSGLDGWQQLTSAYDMSLFLRAAVAQPRFVAYDRQPTAALPAQHVGPVALDPVTMTNQTNDFLTRVPGAILAKIGFTDAAQHTYVCAAERNGRRLGVVLLRAQRYPVDQLQQAASLLDWAAALPSGTAPVGHLDAAVPASPGAGASAAHTAAAAPLAANRPHHSVAPIGLAVAAIMLALGVPLLAAGVSHRRRQPRNQQLRA